LCFIALIPLAWWGFYATPSATATAARGISLLGMLLSGPAWLVFLLLALDENQTKFFERRSLKLSIVITIVLTAGLGALYNLMDFEPPDASYALLFMLGIAVALEFLLIFKRNYNATQDAALAISVSVLWTLLVIISAVICSIPFVFLELLLNQPD
jgi:hypothetical protein